MCLNSWGSRSCFSCFGAGYSPYTGWSTSWRTPLARAAVAAWRRAEAIEVPARRGGWAFANGLLAAVVFALLQTGFSVAGTVSAAVAEGWGPNWPFWLVFAVRCYFGMWLNMLFFVMAAMDREKPLRALGRALAGLFRHFFRIAAMQLALWWETWLLAALVVALGEWTVGPAADWLSSGALLLAVILFFWRGPRVRLAYAGLAMELFGVNE